MHNVSWRRVLSVFRTIAIIVSLSLHPVPNPQPPRDNLQMGFWRTFLPRGWVNVNHLHIFQQWVSFIITFICIALHTLLNAVVFWTLDKIEICFIYPLHCTIAGWLGISASTSPISHPGRVWGICFFFTLLVAIRNDGNLKFSLASQRILHNYLPSWTENFEWQRLHNFQIEEIIFSSVFASVTVWRNR